MLKTITLWRDNQLDQEWEMTLPELAAAYVKAHPTEGGRFMRSLVDFIEKPDGLSSVFECDAEVLADAVWPLVVANRLKA